MIFIYITNPTRKEAKKIAKHLIEKKLIACANIFPVNSLYRWKERIEEENEFVLIGKAKERNFKRIKSEVKKIHPYSIPCIAKVPVSFNKEYSNWIKRETIS